MKIKREFAEEVKHIQAEREHTLSLTQGQRYVIRELRILFGNETNDDTKAQINILEKAFRGTITTALNRELNRLRRNGITDQNLLKTLINLYHQHNMKEWSERRKIETDSEMLPRIICSEGFD